MTRGISPYDYERRVGFRDVSWDEFERLTATLTEALAAAGVNAVVGVARGGLFPASQIAGALRCEMFPVRVSRRVDDRVVRASPEWIVPVVDQVEGRTVAVVDDVADSGETLTLVREGVEEAGAGRVVTAALYAHSWSDPRPDVVGMDTDAFVILPWDRTIYTEGEWGRHPEVESGLAAQGGGQATVPGGGGFGNEGFTASARIEREAREARDSQETSDEDREAT